MKNTSRSKLCKVMLALPISLSFLLIAAQSANAEPAVAGELDPSFGGFGETGRIEFGGICKFWR